MIASTEPVANSTPNSSRASSLVSRRETRLRTASATTAACSLGPNADRATFAREFGACVGRTARAADGVQPVLGHADRDRRQLGDLMPPRLHSIDRLPRHE